jgi:hypothetical protein
VAAEIAAAQGAALDLSDAPVGEVRAKDPKQEPGPDAPTLKSGGGLRVVVTFPR